MTNTLNLRCNICSVDVDEKEIESHIVTEKHIANKSKVPPVQESSTKSVISMWYNSD